MNLVKSKLLKCSEVVDVNHLGLHIISYGSQSYLKQSHVLSKYNSVQSPNKITAIKEWN